MADHDQEAIEEAMGRLRAADRARWQAINDLKDLGVVRSRSFVGDYGEELARRYYEVGELQPPSNAGYDLIRSDGLKVQVKTLRSSPTNFRSTIGALKPDYDLLLAIRLDADYRPVSAIEAPKEAVERHFGTGRVTWTRTLESDDQVRSISPEELLG
jgi:hypothetical protein